jgi:hypothetical protein
MLLLPLLACDRDHGGAIGQQYTREADCEEDLVCHELANLGHWGGYDTDGSTTSICPRACSRDAACPSQRSEPCGEIRGTCEEGWCRILEACEG